MLIIIFFFFIEVKLFCEYVYIKNIPDVLVLLVLMCWMVLYFCYTCEKLEVVLLYYDTLQAHLLRCLIGQKISQTLVITNQMLLLESKKKNKKKT